MEAKGEQESIEGLSHDEEVEEHLRLSSPTVYEIIKQEGDEELARPLNSLWWSGLAAGVAISLSVVAEGLLHSKLPDTPWRPLVENFGYSFGFLIVVLSRLQLFTENTITAVLPLVANRTRHNLLRTLRLWGIVFVANLFGSLAFAFAAAFVGIFSVEQVHSFRDIAHHLMEKDALEMLLHAVPAGFLVAAMVWMLPSARGNEFFVILLMTYLIALGDFAHVVAGSAEAFLLLLTGDVSIAQMFLTFLLPAFVGNVIGGSVLFTVLAYAQVKEEL